MGSIIAISNFARLSKAHGLAAVVGIEYRLKEKIQKKYLILQ